MILMLGVFKAAMFGAHPSFDNPKTPEPEINLF